MEQSNNNSFSDLVAKKIVKYDNRYIFKDLIKTKPSEARKQYLYEIKQQALSNPGQLSCYSKARYHLQVKGDNELMSNFVDKYGNSQREASELLLWSRYRKIKKVKMKVGDLLTSGKCLFVTMNFSPTTLEHTLPETRRRYVARYLKSQSDTYVANIDFGEKNGREHYHAIVMSDKMDYTGWHQFGGIKAEYIRTSEKDLTRTAKYITKLSSHALKRTTQGSQAQRLIYSRNVSVVK